MLPLFSMWKVYHLLSSLLVSHISPWWHTHTHTENWNWVLQIPQIEATAIKHDGKHTCTQRGCKCTLADGEDKNRQAYTSSCIPTVLSQWKFKWPFFFLTFSYIQFRENKFSNSQVIARTQRTDRRIEQ